MRATSVGAESLKRSPMPIISVVQAEISDKSSMEIVRKSFFGNHMEINFWKSKSKSKKRNRFLESEIEIEIKSGNRNR